MLIGLENLSSIGHGFESQHVVLIGILCKIMSLIQKIEYKIE